jgi:hypothetical protein
MAVANQLPEWFDWALISFALLAITFWSGVLVGYNLQLENDPARDE